MRIIAQRFLTEFTFSAESYDDFYRTLVLFTMFLEVSWNSYPGFSAVARTVLIFQSEAFPLKITARQLACQIGGLQRASANAN